MNALLNPSTSHHIQTTHTQVPISPPNTTNPHTPTPALLHLEWARLRCGRRLRTKQRRKVQSQKPDHRLRQPAPLPKSRRTADRSPQVRPRVSRSRRRRGRAQRLAFTREESASRSGGAFGGVGGGGEDGGAQGGGVGAADGFFDVRAAED